MINLTSMKNPEQGHENCCQTIVRLLSQYSFLIIPCSWLLG
uniref:Uncharacterized protein n=1 Tax=Rhizophora mucronata TaxID=61149 RepID=A0A2P2NLC5_RHIMU